MTEDDVGTSDTVDAVFREEWGRLLATLVGWLRDLDLAEEVAADAIAAAVRHWPTDGVPDHPTAWLLTTARRRAVDLLRRRKTYAAKLAILRVEADRVETERLVTTAAGTEQAARDTIGDDRLRLFFTCCHPALAPEARVALTLRYLAGLSTVEVARAFLVPETTMAQRLTRAKRKIREANIPYRVPGPSEIPDRLPAVLSVIYVVFTEAYAASQGPDLTRPDLADEAIRLARILHRLMPHDREVLGLLALLLLTHARHPARTDSDGNPVLLADQDRSRWDRHTVDEGVALLEQALPDRDPGPYLIQAAIAALHDQADSMETTDWPQIVALYNLLQRVAPSPVVSLNRAVAVGMADGPQAGLALLDDLADSPALERYHLFHSARAGLLKQLGRESEAAQAYRQALDLVGNEPERAFLRRQLADIEHHGHR
ncbi:RNA polymerase sigma factor [Stackebrandtia nassauensis]|uniref:Putative RNA polymerase, sigma-24 subunit, ECF subfamily n=1 Tax=Stackebrandtia nassauensis (strain DSM 44728 / CIP 108903 / NRRL B-16338 / NBRC 102104 / LLR-40K-21) TaxID=446470 RepID=D3PVG7_STANL|nr:RNA polymerase sigma factor [Stackebrandtia nassauensis]ADD43081.1 putative RNA polymerase, sigma-24 subunit, ECF subfamily [Stackebrandtia nassauensis DSM 44728]